MNCKPGDLAVVMRDGGHDQDWVGCFVIVTKDGEYGNDGWEWLCRFQNPVTFRVWEDGKRTEEIVRSRNGLVPDVWLKPIRPGDITDEEVRDLYAPSDERATA
jgi:hypothetical protein